MRTRTRTPLAALLAAGCLAAAGCAELDDPSHVDDLRVLGVQVDPSEVILDPSRPDEIPEITVSPLVADPQGGGRPVTWTLTACPNDPRGAPPPPGDYSGGYPAGGAGSSVSSQRCPANPALSWALSAPDEPLTGPVRFRLTPQQLALAFATDRFKDLGGVEHGGFDLGLPIVLELQVRAGEETARAVKRVLFWRERIHDDQRPNETPSITEIRAFEDRDRDTLEPLEPVTPIGMEEPHPVAPGKTLYLEPVAGQAEPYVTAVVDRLTGATTPRSVPREKLRYSFYATAGKFTPLETQSELPAGFVGRGLRVALESKYTPPPADRIAVDPADGKRRQEVTVWIVVRDDRGGLSWVSRRLLVTE